MRKDKYFYNTQTLRYERIQKSWQTQLLRIFGFLCAALVFAFVIVVFSFKYIESPTEKRQKRELNEIALVVERMGKQNDRNELILSELQDRDDNIYRVIFEAEPLPSSVRRVGVGGNDKYKDLANLSNADLMVGTQKQLDEIQRKIYVQSKSYDNIVELLENREEYNSSRPAIQPISNKELGRVASGFGMRIHPIYKTRKMHWGMDFTAPTGTDVYATGKGKIERIQKLKKGYGYNVKIDHGFGMKTLYAHLSEINVKKGQVVNRGDVIGLVGSTGTSTAPHLHYEVIKTEMVKGQLVEKRVNPVYYYYNDLSPKEYERMIELSATATQSFD